MNNSKPLTSPLIKKALYYAAEKHDGQYRKGIPVPFLVHPVLVAFIVSEYTENKDIIVAAILHDVIEDCDVSISELTKLFNKNISKIVKEVSLPKQLKEKKWKDKKEIYLNFISKASEKALLIVAVDKMLNMEAYFNTAINGKTKLLNKLFGGTLEEYFWYYEEILKILESGLKKHLIIKDYKNKLQYYHNKLNS